MNNNTILNNNFPSFYSFLPSSYSFPSSSYSFPKGYSMSGYLSYGSSLSAMPHASATLVRQSIQSIFSSSIDLSSIINKDISGFMEAMIIKIKNDMKKINDLMKLKTSFEISRPDMLIIKNMNMKDHDALNISRSLDKRLSREAGEFLKKKK